MFPFWRNPDYFPWCQKNTLHLQPPYMQYQKNISNSLTRFLSQVGQLPWYLNFFCTGKAWFLSQYFWSSKGDERTVCWWTSFTCGTQTWLWMSITKKLPCPASAEQSEYTDDTAHFVNAWSKLLYFQISLTVAKAHLF